MRRAVLLLCLCAMTVIASPAQTFTTMYDFQGADDSAFPWASLVQGVDGSYYGEAQGGYSLENDLGAIFKITSSGSFITVHHFEIGNPQGPAGPIGGMVRAADGSLYGVSQGGGTYIAGAVFRVGTDDSVTTVYSFCSLGANCPDGATPWGPPIQGADGNFYGTTGNGGTTNCRNGCGTVYRVTPAGALTTLHSFDGLDGAFPRARLALANDGNFYGTTMRGGSTLGYCNVYHGCGTVFRISPNGVFTTVHVFCLQSGCPDGSAPIGGLTQGSDGYLYGMTGSLNATISATIFRMSLQGELTTLYKFPAGWVSQGELLEAPDGNFYGMMGGTPDSIFDMTPSGTVTTLHTFCQGYPCPGGFAPSGSLVLGSDGLFYGTTLEGGNSSGYGTIFSFDGGFLALSVSKTGSGKGTVIGGGGHINCGSLCSSVYVKGQQLELTAIPGPGSTFGGWTGCDNVQGSYCFVDMSAARNVTAAFSSSQVTLTSLVLKPSTVKGGQLSAATLTLSGPAPEGGLGVSIASNIPNAAHPPSWIVVPAGKSTASFAVRTFPVKKSTTVNISASTGGSQAGATLTVITGYGSQQVAGATASSPESGASN